MHAFRLTMTLADRGGGTEVHWRQAFESANELARVRSLVIPANEQNLDRLAAHLAHMASPERALTLSRTLDAPRDLVFRAWTEPERLARWWGPKGFGISVVRLDLRPGGIFHYRMTPPGGGSPMHGRFVYREVRAPDRLVFVTSFADEKGEIARAPFFGGTFPLEILNVLTLAERDGRTALSMTGVPINASAQERATFIGAFESMQKGWGGTLDQLAAEVAKG